MESTKSASGEAKVSPLTFIKDSVDELKKVHTPTRAETVQATIVTLFIMVFISLVLFVFDLVFKRLIHTIVS
jgi:preprotein translocase SecE subunit